MNSSDILCKILWKLNSFCCQCQKYKTRKELAQGNVLKVNGFGNDKLILYTDINLKPINGMQFLILISFINNKIGSQRLEWTCCKNFQAKNRKEFKCSTYHKKSIVMIRKSYQRCKKKILMKLLMIWKNTQVIYVKK